MIVSNLYRGLLNLSNLKPESQNFLDPGLAKHNEITITQSYRFNFQDYPNPKF